MPPDNTQLDKKILQREKEQVVGDKVQACKDRSGLQFVKFAFLTGGPEIRIAILMEL